MIDQSAPAVVDMNFELLQLLGCMLGEAEVVVGALVFRRGDGGGQEEVEIAGRDGDGIGGSAMPRNGFYRISSRTGDHNLLRLFTRTPADAVERGCHS